MICSWMLGRTYMQERPDSALNCLAISLAPHQFGFSICPELISWSPLGAGVSHSEWEAVGVPIMSEGCGCGLPGAMWECSRKVWREEIGSGGHGERVRRWWRKGGGLGTPHALSACPTHGRTRTHTGFHTLTLISWTLVLVGFQWLRGRI